MHVRSSAIVGQSLCINNPLPTVGTFVRASASDDKQRTSTVVAAPSAGLAPCEHTNITLTYTHCRVRPLWPSATNGQAAFSHKPHANVGLLERKGKNVYQKHDTINNHPFCWYLLNNTIISKIILYESCSFSWRIRHAYQ